MRTSRVIATLLIVGTVSIASAFYAWKTLLVPLEIREPLEIIYYPSELRLYPGETKDFNITLQNHASVNYSVAMDFRLDNATYQGNYVTFSNEVYIVAPGQQDLRAWLTVGSDAPSTNASLTIDLTRGVLKAVITDDFGTDSGMWRYVGTVVNIDTGMEYGGSAYRDSVAKYVVLTENRDYQCGVIWLNQDISSTFVAEFKYKAGGGDGGDGLVFMFYKLKDYTPYDGSGLGFVTPPGGNSATAVPGYGIEFDNMRFTANDPSENHIALIKDHVNTHLKYANDSRTEDNQWHNVRIVVGDSSVEVCVDGEVVFTWEGVIDRSYRGLGFSASTASGNNWHIIDDIKIDQSI